MEGEQPVGDDPVGDVIRALGDQDGEVVPVRLRWHHELERSKVVRNV